MDAAAVANPNHRSIHVTLDQQGGGAAQSTAVAPWEAAQKRMNRFVRTVALLERAGNGLGTLAFTWATVVILGGFSTNLGPDFWYATTIVFLEAFRVFSRESRSDDELLFKTTGSIRLKRVILISNVPYYLNVGIVMVSLYGTIEFLLIHYKYLSRPPHQMQFHFLLLAALLALASMVQLPTIVKYMKGHKLLQSSPLVAVLAFGGVLLWTNAPRRFAALVVAPLFVGCLQYSVIAACLQNTKILSNLPKSIQTVGTFIFPVWIAISVPIAFGCMGILVLLGTLLVGNIQVPVALARIGLSSMRLSSDNSHKIHNDENSEHLAPALKIFYSMVLGQGTLYILACICESLLFRRLRRSLARTLKVLEYKEGFQSIDLYYEHAYDKCMEDGVLAQEDLNLVRFAVDSLESNSRARKLAAVQILHSLLLGQEASNTLHVSEITTSTKAVATLISMLGWTGAEDQDIRFFAAKITAKLAGDLLIVGIPGTIQMISSLLDSGEKHYLVKQGISAEIMDINEQYNDNLQLISHGSADINWVEAGYQIRAIQAISDHAVSNSEWKSKIFKFLRHIKNMLSVPREGKEPWTDDNSFPVQGMLILEKLTHDLDNCAEINRTTGLIPKIVRFINYTTDTTNISEQKQDLIMAASLKLVARLASVEGEIGIALRRKILEQPFLLSNLVEILEESNGRLELWGPALVIIAKLAVNEETRQKIGDSQVIIPKLMQTFLCRDGSSNMYFDHVVRMVAGEALSTLTKENTSYCSVLLEETKYDVIEGLKNMLKEDEYAYVAASMLWNLCTHSREKLFQLELSVRLLATLPVVLEKLIDTKGNKQLESLLVLTSQLYNLNPERFAYELESHKDAKRLVQKVVSKLNSSQKPHPEYPRMRRALVEVAISIVESCPCYSTIFREVGMMEALSKVEIASLKVEKYKVFLGNASGVVVENGLHLPDLIDKAKRLIGSTTPTSTTLKPGSHA